MNKPRSSGDPDVTGGLDVFAGTQVHVQALLDHLEAGGTVDDFLASFPSVRRDQAVAFLERQVIEEDRVWTSGAPVGRELI